MNSLLPKQNIMNDNKITCLLCADEEEYKKNKKNFKLKGLVHMHKAVKVQ